MVHKFISIITVLYSVPTHHPHTHTHTHSTHTPTHTHTHRSYYSVLVGWCAYYLLISVIQELPETKADSDIVWNYMQARDHRHLTSTCMVGI